MAITYSTSPLNKQAARINADGSDTINKWPIVLSRNETDAQDQQAIDDMQTYRLYVRMSNAAS